MEEQQEIGSSVEPQLTLVNQQDLLSLDELQLKDAQFISQLDVLRIVNGKDVNAHIRLIKILQNCLQESVRELDHVKTDKIHLEQSLRSSQLIQGLSRSGTPNSTDQSVSDVVRAQNQHILYLQYELGQRDLTVHQATDDIRSKRAQLENANEQNQSLQNELDHTKVLLAREHEENDSLRAAVDSQLRRGRTPVETSDKDDELASALNEKAEMADDNIRFRRMIDNLRSQLEDAIVQIEDSTNEHLYLKEEILELERENDLIKKENSALIAEKQKGHGKMTQDIATTFEHSPREIQSARTQTYKTFFTAIKNRLDDWRELLQNEDGVIDTPVEETDDMETKEETIRYFEQQLQRRNSEVTKLRWSLTAAIQDIDESSQIIRTLRDKISDGSDNEYTSHKVEKRNTEVSSLLKRLLTLEDDFGVVKDENDKLHSQLLALQQGIYGLPEAMADMKSLKQQLKTRDWYIRELVERLNVFSSQLDSFQNITKATNHEIGQLRKYDWASQNDYLPRKSSEANMVMKSKSEETSRTHMEKENGFLKTCMREILEAVRESRVESGYGQSVEIRSPALEKLVTLLELERELVSEPSTGDLSRYHSDSAISSEQRKSPLRFQILNALSTLESLANSNVDREKPGCNLLEKIASKVTLMSISCLQDILEVRDTKNQKKILDGDLTDVDSFVRRHEQEVERTVTNNLRLYVNQFGGLVQKLVMIETDNEVLKSHLDSTAADVRQPQMEAVTFIRHQPEHSYLVLSKNNLHSRSDESIQDHFLMERNDNRDKIHTWKYGKNLSPEFKIDLTRMQDEHRREVETLMKINADLRADALLQEERLSTLRESLAKTNFNLDDVPNFGGNNLQSAALPDPTPISVSGPRNADSDNTVTYLESRIQRLDDELKLQKELSLKERDELIELMTKRNEGEFSDIELNKQVILLQGELAQKEWQMQVVNIQLESANEELHAKLQSEKDLQRHHGGLVNQYEMRIMKLEEELAKSKNRTAPNSSRTFIRDPKDEFPLNSITTPMKDDSKLRGIINEKEEEIKKISMAFQKFKEEISQVQPTIHRPTTEDTVLQQKYQKLEEINNKLTIENRRKDGIMKKLETELAKKTKQTEPYLTSNKLPPNRMQLRDTSPVKVEKSYSRTNDRTLWEERKIWENLKGKLKDKLKEKTDLAENNQRLLDSAKEAISRLEKDKAVMEDQINMLTKRLEEAHKNFSPTKKSLAEALKEIERLNTVLKATTGELHNLRKNEMADAEAREQNYLSALDDMSRRQKNDTATNRKLAQQLRRLSEKLAQTEKEKQQLQSKIEKLEKNSSEVRKDQPHVNTGDLGDMAKSVKTLKGIIDDQQEELIKLRREKHNSKPISRSHEVIEKTDDLQAPANAKKHIKTTGNPTDNRILKSVLKKRLLSLMEDETQELESKLLRRQTGANQGISVQVRGFSDTQKNLRELKIQLRNILAESARSVSS